MDKQIQNGLMKRIFIINLLMLLMLLSVNVVSAQTSPLEYSIAVSDTKDSASLTNANAVTISGRYPESTTLRFFVNSNIPVRIQENSDFILEVDSSTSFNATILLSTLPFDGVLGLNEISIEVEEPGKAKKKVTKYIKVDRLPPRIILEDVPNLINTKQLSLKGYLLEKATLEAIVDGSTSQIALNDDNKIVAPVTLPSDGSHTIQLIATDLAGNKETHNISVEVDTKPCEIEEIEDREILEGETQHFSVITLAGKTSEPNCRISILNLEDDYRLNASEVDDYLRDSVRATAAGEIGLGGLILRYSKDIYSDDEGKFSTQIALKQGVVSATKNYPVSRQRNERLEDIVQGINNLQIIVQDAAGNVDEDYLSILYEPGSGFWKLGRVQTLPNAVYSNNLFAEQSNGVEVSVMYDLHYIGPNSDLLQNAVVSASVDGNNLDNQHVSVSEVFSHYFDDEGKLFVLAKLRVYPNANTVSELKDKISGNEIGSTGSGLQIDFALQNVVSFNIGEEVYTNEQVFLKHAVGVETPFEYTKYLTPEMLDSMISEVEKWNELLAKGVKIAEDTTLALTGACVAKIALDFIWPPNDVSLKSTLAVCDRVWCPSIPPVCENLRKVAYDSKNLKYNYDINQKLYVADDGTTSIDPPGTVIFEQGGTKGQGDASTTYRWVDGKEAKFPSGTRICSDPARPHAVEIRTVNKSSSTGIIIGGESSTEVVGVRYHCISQDEEGFKKEDMRSAAIGCFNPDAPSYDSVKCFPDNAKRIADEGGADTYDDLLVSARCGCASGVTQHLTNVLRISQGFKKCLQQAEIGEVSGAYCERLFAQFTCDLVAWGVEQQLGDDFADKDWDALKGSGQATRFNFGQVKSKLSERYGGIIQSRFGLPSDQFVRKACLGAITGDWNDIEGIFRQAGRIPVKPVIGPLFPESRFTSWNPFTGEAAINYYFTLGILSGGQEVTGTAKVMCDKREPGGDFCPTDRPLLIYEENIYVEQDGSIQRNLFYEDQRARYWGNVVVLELSYLEGDQEKHVTIKEPIKRLNNKVAQCHFTAPALGFSCEVISGGFISAEFKDASLTPDVRTYYPGNDVYIKTDIVATNPDLLKSGDAADETDLYLVYYLRDNKGNVENNLNELRKWKIDFTESRSKDVWFVKKLSAPTANKSSINYELNLTLYHDVNRDGRIDGKDEPVPFGNEKIQTRFVRFNFDEKVPDCKSPPAMEIIYPEFDALVTDDLRSSTSNGVEFTLNDDCNDEQVVYLFDSNTLDSLRSNISSIQDHSKLSSLLRSSAIDLGLNEKKGIYTLGEGSSLVYNYRDGERFDLVLMAEDSEKQRSEQSVSVQKTGGSGVVSATLVDIDNCRLSGGVCKVSCDAGQRDLGSCGDGSCCG
jgi:hypothetical protein